MKKLVQINTVCNASTGKIMLAIQKRADEIGYQTLSLVGRRKVCRQLRCDKYGGFFSFWSHVAINTVFDKQGYGSYFATLKLINRLRKESPDIIHLHNLHGYYLHLPLLMRYLTYEFAGKLLWTFHDCWPITGHCAYFTMAECTKWEEGCFNCPNKKQYPISLFFDASVSNYRKKKEMFTSLKNLTIIVPSQWMKELVQRSYMKQFPVEVISNGIDLQSFRYLPKQIVLKKYGISAEKKILLGVANVWDKRKGMSDLLSLADHLSREYQIVLVGLSKRQMKRLPETVIGIERTENTGELAALYSQAYIFLNPSREESFSLVTIEAMACGTPVIALGTSAVKELINEKNGVVIENSTWEDYLAAIKEIEKKGLSGKIIRETAMRYSNDRMLDEIVKLYE